MSESNWGMLGGANEIVEVRGVSVHLKAMTLKQRMQIGEKLATMEEKADSSSIIYDELSRAIVKIEFPDDSPMSIWKGKPVREVIENITDMSIILELVELVVAKNKLSKAQEKN